MPNSCVGELQDDHPIANRIARLNATALGINPTRHDWRGLFLGITDRALGVSNDATSALPEMIGYDPQSGAEMHATSLCRRAVVAAYVPGSATVIALLDGDLPIAVSPLSARVPVRLSREHHRQPLATGSVRLLLAEAGSSAVKRSEAAGDASNARQSGGQK